MEMVREMSKEKDDVSSSNGSRTDRSVPNSHQMHPGFDFTNNYQRREYSSTKEYAECLRNWMYQYRFWSAFSTFQSALIASMPPPNFNNFHHLDSPGIQSPHQQPTRSQGTRPQSVPNDPGNASEPRYKVPAVWKRVAAEFLDFILLFYTKLLVTFAFLRQTGFVHENLFELDSQFSLMYDISEMDYDKMFTLTSELIALEVINRTCITIVETLCLRRGYAGSIGGATPGKKIMQLKVIAYDDIQDLGNQQIIVHGARDPGWLNAFLRSMIKNFSMAFFFPACFTVYLFRYNRAAYDVLTHTIVVETERQPRQQN